MKPLKSPRSEGTKALLIALFIFFIGGAIVWGLAVAYIFSYNPYDTWNLDQLAYGMLAPFVLPIPAIIITRLSGLKKKSYYVLLVVTALLTPYGAAPLYNSTTDILNIELEAPPPFWTDNELSRIESEWLKKPEERPWLYIEGLPHKIARVNFTAGPGGYADYRNFRRGWIINYRVDYQEPVSVEGKMKLFKPKQYKLWSPKLSIHEKSSAAMGYQLTGKWADEPFSQGWLTVQKCEVDQEVVKLSCACRNLSGSFTVTVRM